MFNNYEVFRNLHDNFLKRIHIACVTDNESIKALVVDVDDDVYAIGKDYNITGEPVKFDAICKEGVSDFCYGRGHVIALTDQGDVFAWGQNDRHQCGNGGKEYLKTPTLIKFNGEKVKSVACGWDHTLALTEEGNVYAWGRNYTAQCGTGTRDNVKFPEKLILGKVKSIACGAGHSMAMLENGQVYGWGENGDGQLGLGRETHCERSPSHVTELNGVKKLVCGTYHTLALTTDGRIFAFGFNDYGQLGIGNTERRHTPQKIESQYGGQFTDVAAIWCRDISLALKENGKYFLWGQTVNGDWTMPTQLNCQSANEGFALNVHSVPVTYTCIVVAGDLNGKHKESLKREFGKISFDAKKLIGRGWSGGRTFRGLYDRTVPVAIKMTDHYELEDTEIQQLVELNHANLIRYYATESDGLFRYIAMELADMNLKEFVDKKSQGEFKDLNEVILLEQMAKGLEYLHNQDIIHLNIRPQNVLISAPMKPKGDRKAIITDYNISASDQTRKTLAMSDGWLAGELLRANDENIVPEKTMDIFALGCLFYYVLTCGKHPFGDRIHYLFNIYYQKFNLDELKADRTISKYHLISMMIGEVEQRPPIEAVLKHLMFWQGDKPLSFLKNANTRMEKEEQDSEMSSNLELNADRVTKGNWLDRLDDDLKDDLTKRGRYEGTSVKDMLRAIRNKAEHYNELNDSIKELTSGSPQGLVSYFIDRFPILLLHTYLTFERCKSETAFRQYYCRSFDSFDHSLPDLSSDLIDNNHVGLISLNGLL